MRSSFSSDILILLLAVVVTVITVLSVAGVYNTNIDAEVYVGQVQSFRQGNAFEQTDLRSFKPFYGFVGSLFPHSMSPYAVILIMNIAFLLGVALISYLLLRELAFEPDLALTGTLWIIMGYPMLKYGLAICTDISGWFFSLATILATLVGIRKGNLRYIVAASLIGFVGSLSKETGALGLLFAGVYMLLHFRVWPGKKLFAYLVALCAPFWILEGAYLIFLHSIGSTTFLTWYKTGWSIYGASLYTPFYFFGVELSTFHVLLPLAFAGLWYVKDRKLTIALVAAVLPLFLWPIFVSRILYLQFIVVVPLALYAVGTVPERWRRPLLVLPILCSLGLYFLAGSGSLFNIISR